jgi:hypothetical protein
VANHGLKLSYNLPGYGHLDNEQKHIAGMIIKYAHDHKFSRMDAAIALATAFQESKLRNLNYGDKDSLGVFQQRYTMGWGSRSQILRPEYAIKSFFEGRGSNHGLRSVPESLRHNAKDIWRAAFQVQHSGDPTGPQQWKDLGMDLSGQGWRQLEAKASQPKPKPQPNKPTATATPAPAPSTSAPAAPVAAGSDALSAVTGTATAQPPAGAPTATPTATPSSGSGQPTPAASSPAPASPNNPPDQVAGGNSGALAGVVAASAPAPVAADPSSTAQTTAMRSPAATAAVVKGITPRAHWLHDQQYQIPDRSTQEVVI